MSMTIIDDETKTIFFTNMTSSFTIDQNENWKNIMIETIYKDSAANDEKFLIIIWNFINYCVDIVHVNDMLKCDDIFTKFYTYFKNDLNECDVSTIMNFTH